MQDAEGLLLGQEDLGMPGDTGRRHSIPPPVTAPPTTLPPMMRPQALSLGDGITGPDPLGDGITGPLPPTPVMGSQAPAPHPGDDHRAPCPPPRWIDHMRPWLPTPVMGSQAPAPPLGDGITGPLPPPRVMDHTGPLHPFSDGITGPGFLHPVGWDHRPPAHPGGGITGLHPQPG